MNVMIKPAPVKHVRSRSTRRLRAPSRCSPQALGGGGRRRTPSANPRSRMPSSSRAAEDDGTRSAKTAANANGARCSAGEPPACACFWRGASASPGSMIPRLLTEVDIRFTAIGEASTRVDLEHRLLEEYGRDRRKGARDRFGMRRVAGRGCWPSIRRRSPSLPAADRGCSA